MAWKSAFICMFNVDDWSSGLGVATDLVQPIFEIAHDLVGVPDLAYKNEDSRLENQATGLKLVPKEPI